MALPLSVAPAAAEQISEALTWWELNRPASPDLLYEELQHAFQLIVGQPGIGIPGVDKGFEGVRRINLRGSRYQLYYQVPDDTVEVLALWHASRGEPPPLADPVQLA